ncbi:unnamed protein product, partial [Arabidopsis halleri]
WSLILGIGCGVKELRSVHGFILKWFQWWMEDSIWLVSGEFSGGIVLNSVLIMEYEYGIKVPEPVYGEALNRIRQWLDWGRNTKLNCVLMDLRSILVGVWYGFTLLVGVYFLWSVYVVISIWVLNSTLRGLVPADSRWFSWFLSGCSLWVSVYLGIILVGLDFGLEISGQSKISHLFREGSRVNGSGIDHIWRILLISDQRGGIISGVFNYGVLVGHEKVSDTMWASTLEIKMFMLTYYRLYFNLESWFLMWKQKYNNNRRFYYGLISCFSWVNVDIIKGRISRVNCDWIFLRNNQGNEDHNPTHHGTVKGLTGGRNPPKPKIDK